MIRARTLDHVRYAETFSVLVGCSTEYESVNAYLCQLGDERLTDPLSMLDVGAGTGMVVDKWLGAGGPSLKKYLGIEPIADHARALRETVARLELQGSVEEAGFSPEYSLSGSFDFILFSHSLYWLPEPVLCVENAFAHLAPGGILLAVLQAPMGVHDLYRLFDPLIEREGPVGPDQGYSSHELVSELRGAGHRPQYEFLDSGFDLTGFFEEDPEAVAKLDELLSFALQVEFSELGEPFRSDVVAYLKAVCVESEGGHFWREPTAVVTLEKPA